MAERRFSVIILFYNHEAFVDEAVESILGEHGDRVEIIAVDNGSTDTTRERLMTFAHKVRVLSWDINRNPTDARNAGAATANGEYLMFLDGDDVFMPWAIDVYETIAETRKPVIMIGDMLWFEGAKPSVTSRPEDIVFVEYGSYFDKDRAVETSASAMVIERKAFSDVGGWGYFPIEDQDLLWKLGTAGRTVQILDPPTTFHRSHSQQTSLQTTAMLDTIRALIQNEKKGRYPGGKERRLERRACLGGVIFHWSRLTLRRGAYGKGAWFLVRNLNLVMSAVALRLRAFARGRAMTQVVAVRAVTGGLSSETEKA